ncbi:MAG: YHS domain-containing protein [Thiohalomonadales bacterium]
MDVLLLILFYAAIFIIMLRIFGGFHLSQRQGIRVLNHTVGKGKNLTHIDPVCGMLVDVYKGYGMMYRGHLYRFCHLSCLDKFELDPNRYLTSINGVHPQGGKL